MAPPSSYEDLEMAWVGDLAGARARVSPDAVALYDVAEKRRYTCAEIEQRVRRCATALVDELGLCRGEVVCCLGRNRVEQIDLYLAAGKLGAIFAPLSHRLAPRELEELLERIRPRVIFFDVDFAELVAALSLPPSVLAQLSFGDARSDYHRITASVTPRDVNRPLRLRDPFLYIHTGGTTAVPKVCVISYRQMYWNGFDVAMSTPWGGYGRRELLTFPFYHIGGWNGFHYSFHSGAESVLLREFDAGTVLRLIDQGHVTHLGAVEAMLHFLREHPSFAATDLSRLESITACGAPCSPQLMEAFLRRGVPVTQAYGLTEAGPANFFLMPHDLSRDQLRAQAHSIGRPMFHGDFKIVDAETRAELAAGEVGVLCLRSPHSFDGYLHDPERTARVLDAEGWVYTGDLAQVDARGNVTIRGRADNMFISGGENVSPEEVEQALLAHPDVAQAICVGVPDARWGQVPFAKVVLRVGAAADEAVLRAHCGERLARFKVPREIVIGDSVPLTGAGKLDRKALLVEAACETEATAPLAPLPAADPQVEITV